MNVSYHALTARHIHLLEEAGVLNGCGPSTWKGSAPKTAFEEDCYEHDFYYSIGGNESDRRHADNIFYIHMLDRANQLPWYSRYWAKLAAWFFYQAVRAKGKAHFRYRNEQLQGSIDAIVNLLINESQAT